MNISDLNEIQLLYVHLVKHYGDEKSKELLVQNKDNLFGFHGLAWSLGKRDLTYFCLYFLSNVFLAEDNAEIAPIHYQIWEDTQNIILNKTHDKQVYLLPRGTGKSLFGSLSSAIWTGLYGFKTHIVIASAIGDTAETFIRNIKTSIDGNTRIKKAFGEVYNPKKYISNNESVELAYNGANKRSFIRSFSASSTLRGKSYNGKRFELLLLDDYQKDDEVYTEDARSKKWKRFSDDVNYAMQKDNSTMIAYGTVQHKECFYSRLAMSPTWKTRQEKGVLVDDVDELFNSSKWEEFKKILIDKNQGLDYAKEYYFQNSDEMQYPLLWKSYWDCLDMALQYYENPESFKQEVQGDVDSVGQKKFKTIVTESAEEIEAHTFTKTVLSVDPAGTSRKGNKHDYYAFVVGSTADNKIIYARKSEIHDFEYDDYIAHVLFLLREYEDINIVSIEKNVYSGADVLKIKEKISEDDELKHRNIEFINEHRSGNKDDRINTIVGRVNLGQVIFNEENEEAIFQLKEFCGAKYSAYDDYPDVLADCIQRLDEVQIIKPIKITPNWFQ